MSVRIVLVDDREHARAGLAQRLRRNEDVELLGAVGDAAQARALAGGVPDLILLDLHEGNEHDQALCRALSDALPAPLVVLVSFMTQERWRALQDAGASRYLLRHVDSRGLVNDLTALASELTRERLSSSRPHSP
jgi:DNA-binding NarL/FixJ family response regulator